MLKRIFMITLVFLYLAIGISAASDNPQLLQLTHDGKENYFDIIAEPGDEICIPFRLVNNTDQEITNHIFVYDSLTAVNGGNIIMTPDEFTADHTAAWFDINEQTVTVSAGKSVELKRTVKVPKDIKDGQYTAVLALYSTGIDKSEKKISENEVGININSHYTSALAVVIRIGSKPQRKIILGDTAVYELDADSGRGYIYIPVVNDGTAYGFPVIETTVYDNNGKNVFKDELNMDIVYMNTDCHACFESTGHINEAGSYRASVKMTDRHTGELLDEGEYHLNVNKSDIKEVIGNIHQAEQKNGRWGNGFLVMDKTVVMGLGAGAAVFIILLSIMAFGGRRR